MGCCVDGRACIAGPAEKDVTAPRYDMPTPACTLSQQHTPGQPELNPLHLEGASAGSMEIVWGGMGAVTLRISQLWCSPITAKASPYRCTTIHKCGKGRGGLERRSGDMDRRVWNCLFAVHEFVCREVQRSGTRQTDSGADSTGGRAGELHTLLASCTNACTVCAACMISSSSRWSCAQWGR